MSEHKAKVWRLVVNDDLSCDSRVELTEVCRLSSRTATGNHNVAASHKDRASIAHHASVGTHIQPKETERPEIERQAASLQAQQVAVGTHSNRVERERFQTGAGVFVHRMLWSDDYETAPAMIAAFAERLH